MRLRQIALAARELEPTMKAIRDAFDLDEGFHDPGVAEFGLENEVLSVGDTFLEVVAPVTTEATAQRYLDRRGADVAGYMAIFQVDDMDAARARVASLGVRVVWQADLDDIRGTHLHPKDVPVAIVSLDQPVPPESWRWGGPAWIGGARAHAEGGITEVVIAAMEPDAVALRWAAVLGVDVALGDGASEVRLGAGAQTLRFVQASGSAGEGIIDVTAVVEGAPAGVASFDAVTVRSAPPHQ